MTLCSRAESLDRRDDDVRNIFALTSALESQNMNVVHAENGQEAIDLLQKTPGIQAVLMDIMMPGMDGYETTAAIRQLPQYKSLPIIALTAKAMKADRDKCIEAGASDYISKPLDIDQLLSLLASGSTGRRTAWLTNRFQLKRSSLKILKSAALGRCLSLLRGGLSQLCPGVTQAANT